jgi:hypothetical protein
MLDARALPWQKERMSQKKNLQAENARLRRENDQLQKTVKDAPLRPAISEETLSPVQDAIQRALSGDSTLSQAVATILNAKRLKRPHLILIILILLALLAWIWQSKRSDHDEFTAETRSLKQQLSSYQAVDALAQRIFPDKSSSKSIEALTTTLSNVESYPTLHDTLHDLFSKDFNFVAIEDPYTIRASGKGVPDKALTVEVKIWLDYSQNCKFVSLFIPALSEIEHSIGTQALRWYAEHHQEKILKANQAVKSGTSMPWDDENAWSGDMVFSGRVYIYHESEFSLIEKGEMVKYFKEKGLFPIFRGPRYVSARTIEIRPIKPPTPTESSALRPTH